MDYFGIEREDIIAYLDDEAIRAEMPAFPGWKAVAAERTRGEKLKDAARDSAVDTPDASSWTGPQERCVKARPRRPGTSRIGLRT